MAGLVPVDCSNPVAHRDSSGRDHPLVGEAGQHRGNTGIWFIGELEDNPESAFRRLCSNEQYRIGEETFLETEGNDYSVLSYSGARGANSQYPNEETLDGDITQAWTEYDIQNQSQREMWRLYLIRERDWWEFKGEWKVCAIEFRG